MTYDFMLKGRRCAKAWFQTKREAKQAEEEQRKSLMKPIPTETPFLILGNKRLDEVQHRLSVEHYMDIVYHAKRWVRRWQDLACSQITRKMITICAMNEARNQTKPPTKELRYLKALFNWGVKMELIES